jgi:hypothetical protein
MRKFVQSVSILVHISMLFFVCGKCQAQFIDEFDKQEIDKAWQLMTGDGTPTMKLLQKNGYATVYVDGSTDKQNVYWTLIKRNIASYMDMKKLVDPDYELRVEAKVRIHNPPRRVNFMVNTQRITNFHRDLMEFDLPDTSWHVISMTTNQLDAVPGDQLNVQFCVTDFGLHQYEVDVDYYKADIINIKTAGRDKGPAVPYHPPIPSVSAFSNHLIVTHDALINSDFPEVNFNNWKVKEGTGEKRILTINGHQWAVLRWDLEKYKNRIADGAGVFEFTTYSTPSGGNYMKAYEPGYGEEFPRVRIIEILGGEPKWEQDKVTYNTLMQGKDYHEIFNEQMIYDVEMKEIPGAKNYITISQPVLQRLLNGTTKGLLIRPLGAIDASFYASENSGGIVVPKLHFNIEK